MQSNIEESKEKFTQTIMKKNQDQDKRSIQKISPKKKSLIPTPVRQLKNPKTIKCKVKRSRIPVPIKK